MVRCPFLLSSFVETVSNKALQPIRFWHVDESVIERVVIWTFAGGGHFRFGDTDGEALISPSVLPERAVAFR
jgi:hypothetical protein